jgi:ankyrin repeat protein
MISTNIFEASREGNIEGIRYFLEQKGADINAKDENGDTPLELAVARPYVNRIDAIKFLISKGADASIAPHLWDHGSETAKILISAGADVNIKDDNGSTPLHHIRSADIAKMLVDAGADVNAKNKWGQTPLHCITMYTKKEETREDMQDFFQESMKGFIEIAQILVSAGADVNAKDDRGRTPLLDATMQGNIDFFKTLVSLGADVNTKDNNGLSPLSTAEFSGHSAIVQFLTKGERNISDEDLKNAQEAAQRGMYHTLYDDYANAIEEYTQAINLDPHYADYHRDRGYAYKQSGQFELAINDLTESIRLDPDNANAYLFRGGAYIQLGKYEQAIKDFDESLRVKPDNYLVLINRGSSYFDLRQYDKAKQDLEKVISLNPDDEVILSYAKDLLAKIG